MSKALKIVAVVAAVVVVGATLGAAAGGIAGLSAATLTTVASVASAVATTASLGSAALQKKPGLKGSVSAIMIGATMAVPYAMGRTYTGGMQVYDNSGDDNNKKRYQVMVVSAAGPIDSYESLLADYATINFSGEFATGWFADYMWKQERLGARPDTAVFDTAGMPGWGANHKLSGYAAYRITMKFDKDGKRYASGVPQMGVVFKGVKVYDPRLDSTYPGGSGTQRWDDEASWAWSENPALHALAYARGRFVNGVRIIGAALPKDSIDQASFVELANLCDANGWTIGGLVYEAPDLSKWDNLKRICQAGGAQPVWAGGMLRLRIHAPRPSLFRIEEDDLAEGSVEVQAMKGWRERRNSIVPKYRSETAKWEYVQGDAVTSATYVAEDGEIKTEEVQFDLVQDKDQAAQLAAYEMVNAREFGPITVSVKPRLLAYRLGEAGTVHIPEAGLFEQLAVITGRSVNPATGVVTLTLESETTAKHAYALGLTGTAPPTPVIRSTQEIDEAAADGAGVDTQIGVLIAHSYPRGMTLSINTSGATIISAHERVYGDKIVSVSGATVTPSPAAAAGDAVGVYYDDAARAGGAVTYQYQVFPAGVGDIDGINYSAEHPYRHFVSMMEVPVTGSTGGGSGVGSGGGGGGPSGGGGLYYNQTSV